jgi:hypothetical protein
MSGGEEFFQKLFEKYLFSSLSSRPKIKNEIHDEA